MTSIKVKFQKIFLATLENGFQICQQTCCYKSRFSCVIVYSGPVLRAYQQNITFMLEGLLVIIILAWILGFIPFAVSSSLLELLLMAGIVLLIVDVLVVRRGHR